MLDRDFFENGLFPRIVVLSELAVQLGPGEEALAVRAEQDRMILARADLLGRHIAQPDNISRNNRIFLNSEGQLTVCVAATDPLVSAPLTDLSLIHRDRQVLYSLRLWV